MHYRLIVTSYLENQSRTQWVAHGVCMEYLLTMAQVIDDGRCAALGE